MTFQFGYWVASDSKPSSNEFKAEGEFLNPCSLAIKGLAPKASNCYICPSLLWPGHWGSFLRSRLCYHQLFPFIPPLDPPGFGSWCSPTPVSPGPTLCLFQGFRACMFVYLLFSLLCSIGETCWHLVSLQKHGKREWLNETILVDWG